MHFSRIFISKIKEVTGKSMTGFGQEMVKVEAKIKDFVESLKNEETMTTEMMEQYEKLNWEQFDLFTDLVYAGMLAYSAEINEEVDYDQQIVGSWLWDAMNQDDKVLVGINKALTQSMPKGKQMGPNPGVRNR